MVDWYSSRFAMSLRTSLLIEGVLALIGTSLDGMDFLMASRKDLDHFLQKMTVSSDTDKAGLLNEFLNFVSIQPYKYLPTLSFPSVQRVIMLVLTSPRMRSTSSEND